MDKLPQEKRATFLSNTRPNPRPQQPPPRRPLNNDPPNWFDPPRAGEAGRLASLNLSDNSLTGPIPPELADLDSLWILSISYNADLSGALPDSLVSLQNLASFHAGGTDLCAPLNSSFNAWLEALRYYRVAPCDPGAAYLTQAVQSRDYPVALVEGEKALLRAFVTVTNPGKATMPPVVARFYRDGREVHEVEISATSHPIPKKVAAGILKASANAEIPGRVVRPDALAAVQGCQSVTGGGRADLARLAPDRVRAHRTALPCLAGSRPGDDRAAGPLQHAASGAQVGHPVRAGAWHIFAVNRCAPPCRFTVKRPRKRKRRKCRHCGRTP